MVFYRLLCVYCFRNNYDNNGFNVYSTASFCLYDVLQPTWQEIVKRLQVIFIDSAILGFFDGFPETVFGSFCRIFCFFTNQMFSMLFRSGLFPAHSGEFTPKSTFKTLMFEEKKSSDIRKS